MHVYQPCDYILWCDVHTVQRRHARSVVSHHPVLFRGQLKHELMAFCIVHHGQLALAPR